MAGHRARVSGAVANGCGAWPRDFTFGPARHCYVRPFLYKKTVVRVFLVARLREIA